MCKKIKIFLVTTVLMFVLMACTNLTKEALITDIPDYTFEDALQARLGEFTTEILVKSSNTNNIQLSAANIEQMKGSTLH